jgi:hypothetical protein
MTDRELLELAAKAAGFGDPQTGHICWTESEYPPKSRKQGALWNYVGHMDTAELWNPLTDDGDALRLAVKLNILKNAYLESWIAQEVGKGLDWYAATRRVIVWAAAEIGRAMP